MTKKDYCSYEVSKLLKEKGFNESCNAYYEDGKFCWVWNDGCSRNTDNPKYVSCPTQSLAMRWLRDYPNYIFIGIENQYLFTYEVYYYHIRCNAPKREVDKISEVYYRTYEEAIDAALKYCLTKLV